MVHFWLALDYKNVNLLIHEATQVSYPRTERLDATTDQQTL